MKIIQNLLVVIMLVGVSYSPIDGQISMHPKVILYGSDTIPYGDMVTDTFHLFDISNGGTSLGFQYFNPWHRDSTNPYDPGFVDNIPTAHSSAGNPRLRCGPAVNAGTPDTTGLMLGLTDLDGMPRILDGTIEIGAFELAIIQDLFVDDPTLAQNGESGVFRADNLIESDATIKTSNTVDFRFGNELIFYTEFTVEAGALLLTLKEIYTEGTE